MPTLSQKPPVPPPPPLSLYRPLAVALLACWFAVAGPFGKPPVLAQTGGQTAASPPAFTLQEAMDYGAERSPSVRASAADLAEAEGQIKETLSIGLPKVNGSLGYQYNLEVQESLLPDFVSPTVFDVLNRQSVQNTTTGEVIQPVQGSPQFIPVQFGLRNQVNAGLSVNSLLFDATYFIALRGARLFRNLAERTLEQTAYQTRVQVAKAYLATLIAERNRATLDRNVANLEQTLAETRALYDAGFAEKLSVDRLVLTASNLAAQRESLTQVIAISRNLLKFQMGYPIGDPIALATDFEDALGTARIAELLGDDEFDVSRRPEYATLQVADSLNAIDLTRIRAGYYPSLVGFASVTRQLQRDDLFDADEPGWLPGSSVGVTLNVPIFDGFEKRAQRQRAVARSQKTRVQIAQFEESARLALANARASVRNARLAVTLREDAVALAEEIYRVAQIKFREGVGSSLEVNQAQAELYQAQDALTQALYDLAVAYVDYEDSLGEL